VIVYPDAVFKDGAGETPGAACDDERASSGPIP